MNKLTFEELNKQELKHKQAKTIYNKVITIVITLHFSLLLFLLLYYGHFNFLGFVLNALISGICVYLSYKLRLKELDNTITNRLVRILKDVLDESIDTSKIDVRSITKVGYIFTYQGISYIYTTIDNNFTRIEP